VDEEEHVAHYCIVLTLYDRSAIRVFLSRDGTSETDKGKREETLMY